MGPISVIFLVFAISVSMIGFILFMVSVHDGGKGVFIASISLFVCAGACWVGTYKFTEIEEMDVRQNVLQHSIRKQGWETCRVLLQRGMADFILIPRSREIKVERE